MKIIINKIFLEIKRKKNLAQILEKKRQNNKITIIMIITFLNSNLFNHCQAYNKKIKKKQWMLNSNNNNRILYLHNRQKC